MTRNVPVPAPIRAMVIAIPANDEEERIVNCVESVRESVAQISGSVRSVVVVACDSCTDATTALVEELARAATNLCVVEGEWGSAGGARRAAIAFGLGAIEADGPVSANSIWLATTDGDTYVPVDWLRRHLDHADAGADAVAGTVELIDDLDRSPEVIELFRETYELGADESLSRARCQPRHPCERVPRSRRVRRNPGVRGPCPVERSAPAEVPLRLTARRSREHQRPPAGQGERRLRRHDRRCARWMRAALAAAVAEDLPRPGGGSTARRFRALHDLAHRDLELARLAEAHHDARAIASELGAVLHDGSLYAVWAAAGPEPLTMEAIDGGRRFRMRGVASWCTGAGIVDRALVTVRLGDNGMVVDVPVADGQRSAWFTGVDVSGLRSHQHDVAAIRPRRRRGRSDR